MRRDIGSGRRGEVDGLRHVTSPAVAVCRWEKRGREARGRDKGE